MKRKTVKKTVQSKHNLDRIIEILLYATVILVPLVYVRSLDDSFILPKGALAQFFIFEMFLLWLMKMVLQREFKMRKSPLYVPLFLFIGIEILSLIWTRNIYLSVRFISQDLAFGLLVLVVINTVRTEDQFRKIMRVAIYTACAVAVLGLLQYFYLDILSLFPGGEGNIFSTIGHYNFLAAYLNTVIPAALIMAIIGRKRRDKWIFGAITLILFFTLLLTKSRGAWMGGVAAFSILCAGLFFRVKDKIKLRRENLLPAIITGITMVILVLAIGVQIASEIYVNRNGYTLRKWMGDFLNSTTNRAVSTFYIGKGSAMHRRIIWIPTLLMIKNNPLTGVGKNNFQIMYPTYTPEKYKEALHFLTHRGNKVHNEYLQVFAEIGIFGLAAFLWFLYRMLKLTKSDLITLKDEGKDRYFLELSLLAGVAAILIHSLFSHPLRLPTSSLYFWLFTGFIGGIFYTHEKKRGAATVLRDLKKEKGICAIIFLLIIITMAFVPFFVGRPVLADYYVKKGDVYANHERYNKALHYYRKAFDYGCHDPDVFRNVGSIYFHRREYTKAIEHWHKELKVNPNFPQAYNYLGSAFFLMGDFVTAETMFLKALEIYPEYEDVRQRLKELYRQWGTGLKEGGRLEEAKEIYLRALHIFEEDEQFHVRLGYIYYESGWVEEAVREFEIAIQREPDCAEAHKALGYIYANSNEPFRAMRHFDHYMTLYPDAPEREAIEKQMQEITKSITSNDR